jgi:DinB family protein
MAMTPAQRRERIRQYERGPLRLRDALILLPDPAIRWRPSPESWSAQEPHLIGHDPDVWMRQLDYGAHPLEPAVETIEALRANTTALLKRLPPAAWTREARQSDAGIYSVDDWLTTWADHLDRHAREIELALTAWQDTLQVR